jgi:uncharacterized membrane-anchored protein
MSGSMKKGLAACAAALLACTASAADQPQQEQQKVWDAAMKAASKGPIDVPLLDQAVLHLPAGEVFVPQPQADQLLAVFGNPGGNPEMSGVILPRRPDADWYMPVVFHKVGHVDDSEAQTWDVDAMMAGYRAGTVDQNVERARLGEPTVEAVEWVLRPRYDGATHRLEWAMSSRASTSPASAPPNINYNTTVLGREGYFRLDMVSSMSDLGVIKAVVERQLDAVEFMPGKRYGDFDPRTDHVASQGLSTLVLGERGQRADGVGAAFGFLTRYAVPIVIALLAIVAGAVLLRRRKPAAAAQKTAA